MIKSPLSQHSNITKIASFQVKKIIKLWHDKYSIDVTSELNSQDELTLYECHASKLKFFEPLNLTGSGEFYEKLQKFSWYYVADKWEYGVAIDDLHHCQSVLEVGSGQGAFIERVQQQCKIEIQGIELNPNAVRMAQAKHLPVVLQDITEMVQDKAECFDAICAFQVLEHLSQPQEFLQLMLKLLRPGGLLLISVPNGHSFMRHAQEDILNMPPHHVTQWNANSLRYLSEIFPLHIKQIKKEPLASYHVDFYIDILLDRLKQRGGLNGVTFRLAHRGLKPLLQRFPRLRRFIVGHTIYACFQKYG